MPKKHRRPKYSSKISHVYGTEKNESVFIVKLVNGRKRIKIPSKTIDNEQLLTDNTTWAVERIGCRCRYEKGKDFRFVFWTGFAKETCEHVDFVPDVLYCSDNDE
jgi:hypothetical protein